MKTMTKKQLEKAIVEARHYPHSGTHKGKIVISPAAYTTKNRETNLCISRSAFLDCTGSIHIGPWCMFGENSRIYTHDHIHIGKNPLLETQERFGVVWQDKYIGADVWLHYNAIVLYQVTHIPDGVVVGAGSVLTKNPGSYEIWVGAPAKKVGVRESVDEKDIEHMISKKRNLL